MTSVKIGGVTVEGNAFLAPLAGVTDIGFRYLARRYGAALTYTEMVSAKGLLYENKNTVSLLATAENETVKAVQLFGEDPAAFAEAVQREELAGFDIVDINMGCPVPKIVKNGAGSALMKDLPRAAKIVEACVKHAGRPVTVKFRKGFDDAHCNCVEFARMCEESGASLVTVHGRTREQMYTGRADWDAVASVAAAVKIPVIGNGDVFSREDASRLLAGTGCAGVMVARGALGRPWIFAEIDGKQPVIDLSEVVATHVTMLRRVYPDRYVAAAMRKHVAWYVRGLPNAARIRAAANTCTDTESLLELIKTLA